MDQKHDGMARNVAGEDDEQSIRFSVLDVLRMAAGLVLLIAVMLKFGTGSFFPRFSAKNTSSSTHEQVPGPYWATKSLPLLFSASELAHFSGRAPNVPILLGIKSHVFDVSSRASMYGPRGPYSKFAGCDCSRVFSHSMWDVRGMRESCSASLDALSGPELERVDEWLRFFERKYPLIGYMREPHETHGEMPVSV
ncbi:LAMI_0H00980g1_1 [Lachancea mirantina]|uniref:LAMI_0H00980g1_1 n=1 Tax=Lachancea mirantina TaxID=1230905 RepID=A0A1G4KDP2_9SACH|nr:LAMI_0H00980g1_1 [Lachancea mirantina]